MKKNPETKKHNTSDDRPSARFIFRRSYARGNDSMADTGFGFEADRLKDLQTKLEISRPSDPYEQEADRVANQIMCMPPPYRTVSISDCQASSILHRKTVLRHSAKSSNLAASDVHFSQGQPLDSQTKAFFEPRFMHDFSRVRVHTDHRAAQLARSVGARAYTVGEHVGFGEKQFAPGSKEGRRLLAHELTHVVQQSGAERTIAPLEEIELGDSTLINNAENFTGAGDRSLKAIPKLRSNLMLQRAACPCCANAASIGNINQIDNASYMGHSFDVTLDLQYPASGPAGSCELEWWEKTNVPAIPGHPPNTWTNMFALLPTSPTFNPWNNRSETCATSSPVTITDPPSLGKRPGRTVTRTLEFRIVINSMPQSSDSGCTNASQQVTATQVLTMVNGAPNWGASSFTTP